MELLRAIYSRIIALIGFIVVISAITFAIIGYNQVIGNTHQNSTERVKNNQTTTIFQNTTEVSTENTTDISHQNRAITTEFL